MPTLDDAGHRLQDRQDLVLRCLQDNHEFLFSSGVSAGRRKGGYPIADNPNHFPCFWPCFRLSPRDFEAFRAPALPGRHAVVDVPLLITLLGRYLVFGS
jgi:hypothetical protein